jgi:hypothetical protein
MPTKNPFPTAFFPAVQKAGASAFFTVQKAESAV